MAGPLTRFYTEDTIVRRTRNVLTQAGMSTTVDPATPNPDLSDPIATGLAELGYPAADVTNVGDLDLARVPMNLQARLLDLIELRVLESAAQQIMVQAESVSWDDFKKTKGMSAKGLQDFIDARWKRYLQRWAQSGPIAVGCMAPVNQYNLNTSGYFPLS
jgi:hypothetical protein